MSERSPNVAYALFDAGRYEEAYPRLKELAEGDDGWASLYLGWMYHRGLACPIDLGRAENFYLRAYERKVSEAAYYLGTLYRSMRRYEEAVRYLDEAIAKGNPSAAYWTYFIYNSGEGLPKNPGKARQLLQKAADLGHIFARRDLAKRMMRGEFGLTKVPFGFWLLIANVFRTARIATSNPEDLRLR